MARGSTADRGELGGIVTGWLLRLGLFLAALAVVVHEVLAVVVTTVSLDDTAREVARAASAEYRGTRSFERVSDRAEEVAAHQDATVTAIGEDDGELVVALEREAPTLLVHRIGPLDGWAVARVTSRTRLAS